MDGSNPQKRTRVSKQIDNYRPWNWWVGQLLKRSNFWSWKNTPAKIPQQLRHSQLTKVENALENAAQEAELERIQLKNKAVAEMENPSKKKHTGMCSFKGFKRL